MSRLAYDPPLMSYQFRLTNAPESVVLNTESIFIDYKAKTIKIKVRATRISSDFEEAIFFSNSKHFVIQALDGGLNPVLGLYPFELECISYTNDFSYGKNEKMMHDYVFSFQTIEIMHPVDEASQNKPSKSDPYFPTVSEAMEQLKTK